MQYCFGCLILIFAIHAVEAIEISPGVITTPDSHFEDLEDHPFPPNYMQIQGLRIHYLDEGPKEANPVFLMHGLPTWGYLFRTMIPVLTDADHTVIVPGLVGFGKSDKFISKHDYSYEHYIDVMKELVKRLDISEATFFGQEEAGPRLAQLINDFIVEKPFSEP